MNKVTLPKSRERQQTTAITNKTENLLTTCSPRAPCVIPSMYHLHAEPSNVYICRIGHYSNGEDDHELANHPWLAILAVFTSLSDLLGHAATSAFPGCTLGLPGTRHKALMRVDDRNKREEAQSA
jgi:hypothetical protein